jgi:hypothetical protein
MAHKMVHPKTFTSPFGLVGIICRNHHLSMKEGSLFCFCSYEIHQTGMLQITCSWCRWKALNDKERCMGLVPWRLDLF